jgi:hypothetical protein
MMHAPQTPGYVVNGYAPADMYSPYAPGGYGTSPGYGYTTTGSPTGSGSGGSPNSSPADSPQVDQRGFAPDAHAQPYVPNWGRQVGRRGQLHPRANGNRCNGGGPGFRGSANRGNLAGGNANRSRGGGGGNAGGRSRPADGSGLNRGEVREYPTST